MQHEEATAARYVYVWAFQIVPESRAEFLRAYGSGGAWEALFQRAEGFVGTLLLQDQADPNRYLTIDRWRSAAAHAAFRAKFGADYETLDRVCEHLTTQELSLGEYWER
jgi:quinol monooxygenase YgiN